MSRIVFALSGVALAALALPAAAQTAKPAPVAQLVRSVDIPYTEFTLPNGLRVLVHTDRKAPIVAVGVWYNVGAKFEPKGKTGFAHLFEHLMFNGSENAPGDFFEPLEQAGATDFNGTTNSDRTNYFETVPTTALDRALFLESDRMGYLTGAITQGVLDEQRGVVQNEKRQGDNQPYGLVQYKLTEGLYAADHPYGHTTIGSMADLDAATLDDVKNWFRGHYGPNNAVLVLAGDIDVATAKTLVTKYFSGIPRGPASVVPTAPVPTLAAPKSEVMKDRVAATMLMRAWAVPGFTDPQSPALDVAAAVLGGGASSRLYSALVRQEKTAVSVSASNSGSSQAGQFMIRVIVRPGADPVAVGKRTDEILADFLANGPTSDEVQRVVTRTASATIAGLESVGGFGGKGSTLAQGELYSNDPAFYKKDLLNLAASTPASVKAAADQWLTRPVYALTVEPGPRDAYAEAVVPPKATVVPAADIAPTGTRGPIPPVNTPTGLTFPQVTRTRLHNGIELIYAQRSTVPFTRAVLSFDAGAAADVTGKLGTQRLTTNMLVEGTTTKDAVTIAQKLERMGASISPSTSLDRTILSLSTPSVNLRPAVELFADVARHPAFAPAEVARVKVLQLAAIQQELTNPSGLAQRVTPKLAFGKAHPYSKSAGAGDPTAVMALTRDDLVVFQLAWLRPDKAKIFVVSDRPLAEVKAALELGFGDWTGTGAAGVKDFAAPPVPSAPKILLVDRPDSPQSTIVGVLPTSFSGSEDLLPEATANEALGGGFLGRINMDLRETKHWAYGAGGNFQHSAHAAPYMINAPVQADRTGESIAALRQDVTGFVTNTRISKAEFDRIIPSMTRSLPGNFETAGAVLGAMQSNDLFGRPDDYYATITQKYQALTLPQLDAAAHAAIDPSKLVWVVVGDAKVVRPQLDSLGLPVEVVPAASVAGAN
ncbi:pitrilysin family protein [soil metagenome]